MTPKKTEPEDDPRRPKNPFDDFLKGFGIPPDDFDRLFEQMQHALQEAMRGMGGIEPGKPYVHGFSFKVGPDGKPQFSEFGNRPQRPVPGAKPILSEQREPLTDVIEDRDQVSVTIELPGVEKKAIDIRVTESELEINVDTVDRKYHKLLPLPGRVKPDTTKATYKNGILDVVVQKERPSPAKAGHKVKVE